MSAWSIVVVVVAGVAGAAVLCWAAVRVALHAAHRRPELSRDRAAKR